MKKLLLLIPAAAIFLPGFASAAYDSVSIATSTSLTIGTISLTVSGSQATIESIDVGATTLTVTMLAGSVFQVTAPNLNKLVADVGLGRNVDTCTGSSSVLGYSIPSTSDTVVVTITPSSSLCTDPATASTAASKSDAGGGGGGGGGETTVVANPVPVAATTASKEAQIQSIMQAIAALQAQMQTLTGAPAAQVSAISGKITANLSSGSRGASVKALQQFLNTHGFVIATSGSGSPGKETETFGSLTVKAVQKFQEKYNIAKPGEPGYGRVGPKTRAKINELSQ